MTVVMVVKIAMTSGDNNYSNDHDDDEKEDNDDDNGDGHFFCRDDDGTDGKNKKKLKRRLPQWAHEELKETAKRVREEHADPEKATRHSESKVAAYVL